MFDVATFKEDVKNQTWHHTLSQLTRSFSAPNGLRMMNLVAREAFTCEIFCTTPGTPGELKMQNVLKACSRIDWQDISGITRNIFGSSAWQISGTVYETSIFNSSKVMKPVNPYTSVGM